MPKPPGSPGGLAISAGALGNRSSISQTEKRLLVLRVAWAMLRRIPHRSGEGQPLHRALRPADIRAKGSVRAILPASCQAPSTDTNCTAGLGPPSHGDFG